MHGSRRVLPWADALELGPLVQMQDDSSVRQRQAQGLSAAAVLLCTAAFAVIAICSYGVFGKKTSPDVLNNYSLKALEKLLWTPLAQGGA